MKQVPINEQVEAVVTQMRVGDVFGDQPGHMEDGNMIPRLCKFAGEAACSKTCQLKLTMRETGGKMCAEENMATVLNELGVRTENFINVQCTGDNVAFGDALTSENTNQDRVGFTVVPASNAFFFRPGIDKTPQGGDMTHAAMRMADCGDVIYTFADWDGNDVVGISHFSRPNMVGAVCVQA